MLNFFGLKEGLSERKVRGVEVVIPNMDKYLEGITVEDMFSTFEQVLTDDIARDISRLALIFDEEGDVSFQDISVSLIIHYRKEACKLPRSAEFIEVKSSGEMKLNRDTLEEYITRELGV